MRDRASLGPCDLVSGWRGDLRANSAQQNQGSQAKNGIERVDKTEGRLEAGVRATVWSQQNRPSSSQDRSKLDGLVQEAVLVPAGINKSTNA